MENKKVEAALTDVIYPVQRLETRATLLKKDQEK